MSEGHLIDGAGICVFCNRCQDVSCCPSARDNKCNGRDAWRAAVDHARRATDRTIR